MILQSIHKICHIINHQPFSLHLVALETHKRHVSRHDIPSANRVSTPADPFQSLGIASFSVGPGIHPIDLPTHTIVGRNPEQSSEVDRLHPDPGSKPVGENARDIHLNCLLKRKGVPSSLFSDSVGVSPQKKG